MNRIVERIRAMLKRQEILSAYVFTVKDDIEELCDEAEALQDVNDRLMRVGDYAPALDSDRGPKLED